MNRWPTIDELLVLPKWVVVAFAARCARKVFPLIERQGKVQKKYVKAIEDAIVLVEQIASGLDNLKNPIERVHQIRTMVYSELESLSGQQKAAALVAGCAIDATVFALGKNIKKSAECAARAGLARFSVFSFDFSNSDAGTAEMWKEYEALRLAAAEEDWTTETRLLPSFFDAL